MLKALNGEGALPELGCIRDMRVTFPEIEDTAETAAVLVAFSALSLACKATQVCGMLLVRATTVAHTAAPALSQEQNSRLCLQSAVHFLIRLA